MNNLKNLLGDSSAAKLLNDAIDSKDTPLGDLGTLKDERTLKLAPGGIPTLDVSPDLHAEFNVNAAFKLALLNESTDADPSDICDDAPEDGDDGIPARTPPILYSEKFAWLRYTTEIAAGLSLGGKFTGSAGIGGSASLSASTTVRIESYRCHTRKTTLFTALAADLENFGTALSVDDILALEPQEALAAEFDGKLAFTVKATVADLLPAALAKFSAEVVPGRTLSVESEAGASVSLSASVEDTIQVVFSRDADGTLVVSLRKSRTQGVGAGATLGFKTTIKLSGDPELKKLSSTVIAALTDAGKEDLAQLIQSTDSYDNLAPVLKKLADKAYSKLFDRALSEVPQELVTLRDKIKQLLQFADTWMASAIEKKIQGGFEASYSRVEENVLLLQAEVTEKQLRALHTDLLRLNADGLIPLAREGGFFLSTETLTETVKASLRLDLFGEVQFGTASARQTKLVKITTVRDGVDLLRATFAGQLTRQQNQLDLADSLGVGLQLVLPAFVLPESIRLRDFAPAITLRITREKLSWRERLDDAMLWGIIAEDLGRLDAQSQAAADFTGDDASSIETVLTFPAVVLSPLLALLAQADDRAFARALGAAMPGETFWFPPQVRADVYEPVWQSVLISQQKDRVNRMREASAIASARLSSFGNPDYADLAKSEQRAAVIPSKSSVPTGDYPEAVASRVFYQDPLAADWRAAMNAGAAIGSDANPQWENSIKAVVDRLAALRGNALLTRAFGRLLLDLARDHGVDLTEIVRSATLTNKKSKKTRVLGGAA